MAIGIKSPSSPTSIPPPPLSPSLISLMVSVDVKHHVYLLTLLCLFWLSAESLTKMRDNPVRIAQYSFPVNEITLV